MSAEFRIDLRWVERDGAPSLERHCLAEIGIEAGGVPLTATTGSARKGSRKRIRASAYHLATWFVSNWWRLRWESAGSGSSWEMSHRMGAVANGYLWPDVEISGSNETVRVRAEPTGLGSPQALRFLHGADIDVPANEFEATALGFVEAVASRVESSANSQDSNELPLAWRDLSAELKDAAAGFERSLEARMGFDPEQAAPRLLSSLQDAAAQAGRSAVEELADASKDQVLQHFRTLWRALPDQGKTLSLGGSQSLAETAAGTRRKNAKPWMRGVSLARAARREWSTGDGPLDTPRLAELCGVPPEWIRQPSGAAGPMPAALRDIDDPRLLKASLQKRHPNGRRYALARIIGDHIATDGAERLLPVTDAGTDRQKYQRAFATEFLCPFESLRDYIGTRVPDDDILEDAGQHFKISPVLIQSALLSHGVMNRRTLEP